MSHNDLQSFLLALEKRGDLARVRVEVDPEFEIAEIAQRCVQRGGPALLFENVRGSRYPLAINFLGSFDRVEAALGMHPEHLGERLVRFAQDMMPPDPARVVSHRGLFRRLAAMRPRRVRRPVCQQEVLREPCLDDLPVLRCWPQDGGRFITFPLVLTRHPVSGQSNMGIYRMQVFDGKTTGMHWQLHKGGGFHFRAAEERGRGLEVAVALGADPALMLAGIFPLPEALEEVVFAGLLRGGATRMARAATVAADVPASAEFVLEGVVPAGERRTEGPFGDHFGHYCEVADFPVFHVRAITHRSNPIYPAAVVGKPPQEDRYMGDASQMVLGPLIRLIRPEVRDVWAYYEAGFHNLLVVSMNARYAREPMRTAMGILGEGQLGLSKVLVLVDDDVDARSFPSVLDAIRRNFDPATRFQLIANAPLDTLDFTSAKMHLGSRMILDATSEREAYPAPPSEAPSRTSVGTTRITDDLTTRVPGVSRVRLWNDALLVVQLDSMDESAGSRARDALREGDFAQNVPVIALVGPDVNLDDDVDTIWGIFTRFDPARDIRFDTETLVGAHAVCEGSMYIDATWKPGYPDAVGMPDEIVRRVDERWSKYFPRR